MALETVPPFLGRTFAEKPNTEKYSMKIIANTTTRAIHAHYKLKGVVGTATLASGLNSVEPEVYKAMKEQPALMRYFESGKLSVNDGDLEAAADITDAADNGVESKKEDAPKPEATNNQRNEGPSLAATDSQAVKNGTANPSSEKPLSVSGKKTVSKKAVSKKTVSKKTGKAKKNKKKKK